MKMLILRVPAGFNAELYCNVATSMTRDSQNEFDSRDYDFELGEYVRPHYVAGDRVYAFGDNEYIVPIEALMTRKPKDFELYEINADWLDMALLDSLVKLQELCPEVEMWFENNGDGKNEVVDWDYGWENYCNLYRAGKCSYEVPKSYVRE